MSSARPYNAAVAVIDTLKRQGHSAWIVGGAVRDHLLGHAIEDADEIDITTDARPDRLAGLFRSTFPIGKAFGVMQVRMGGHCFEVATFRSDGAYRDGRRPEEVRFGTVEEDVQRRDFTVNALLFDVNQRKIVDLVGGERDLERRLIRCIGDPVERFGEDALRLLRAVRFGTSADFTIEAGTLAAIKQCCDRMTLVAGERIHDELQKIAERPLSRRGDALRTLVDTGLARHTFPGADCSGIEWHAFTADCLQQRRLTSLLAVVMRVPSFEPGRALHVRCERLATALRLSRDEARIMEELLAGRCRYAELASCSLARQRLLATRPDYVLHEDLLRAEDGRAAGLDLLEELRCRYGSALPVPLCDGNDLIALGMPRGRDLGHWLRRLRWAQLAGRLNTREEALQYLRQRGLISSF